jgi:tetratricopeptide (TPR) repeat protein
MKEKLGLGLAFLLIILVASHHARAQADEEAAGQAAEAAGNLRQAFTHYMASFKAVSDAYDKDRSKSNTEAFDRIRTRIINVVRKLKPPPAVPDEAIALEGRAEAAFSSARKPQDYLDAADAYRRAITLAPWVPQYYFNGAVAEEMVGQLEAAILGMKRYLLAAPEADDATAVRKKIAGLEYQWRRRKGTRKWPRLRSRRKSREIMIRR